MNLIPNNFESRLSQLKTSMASAHNEEEKVEAQAALGRFWYFMGLNLWGYSVGRGPLTMGSFGSTDELDSFFATVPRSCSGEQAYIEAEPLLKAAHIYYSKAGQDRQAADLARDLSLLSDKLSRWDDVRALNKEALERYTRIGDKEGMAIILSDMSYDAWYREGDYPRAQNILDQAKSYYAEVGNKMGVAKCLINKADIYDPARLEGQFGNLGQCESLLNEAYDILLAIGEVNTAIDAMRRLIRIYEEQKNLEKEEQYFLKLLETALKHSPNVEVRSSNYAAAADFYEQRGDLPKRDHYLDLVGKSE